MRDVIKDYPQSTLEKTVACVSPTQQNVNNTCNLILLSNANDKKNKTDWK